MKKSIRFPVWLLPALFLCLAWCLALPCLAAQEPTAPPNRVARAGVFAFDGYHEKDKDGRLSGYGIEFLHLLSQYSHLNFDYAGFDKSWKDMLDMLKAGEIDMVTSARRTPEREKLFAFSIPIGKNATVLSAKADNTSLRVGEDEHWNGIRIGVLKGSTQNATLEKYARHRGFTYVPVEFDDAHELAAALQAGGVDAILTSNLRKAVNEKALATLDANNFYAIVRKDDTDLINEINYAIGQMDLNEGDWRNILFYRHYGPAAPARREFAARENDFIRRVRAGEKTLTVAAAPDRHPYSWREGSDMKGILPDYFKKVMEEAGLPFTWAGSNGRETADIIIDSTSPAAGQGTAGGFDTPVYLTTGIAQVARQDHRGPIKTIALADAHLTPALKKRLLRRQTTYLSFPTQAQAMQAVVDGRADAAYVDGYAAQNFVNQDMENALIYSMLNNMSVDFRMHVPARADHELATILKKSMERVPDGEMSQLVSHHTSHAMENVSLLQYMKKNPKTSLLLILVAAFLLCLIFALFLKSRLNRQLLTVTEKANRELENQLAIVEALSRDYTNVYAINERAGLLRVIKLEGYIVEGLHNDDRAYPYEVIMHGYIRERVHPDDRAPLSQALSLEHICECLKANGECTGTYKVVTEEGDVQHYQYTYIRLKNEGKSFILAGFRNIDELIRKEQEQKAALAAALDRAKAASAAKTKFLNSMSHDIRTPMNAILGFTHLAAANAGDAPLVQQYLGKITTSGNHLLTLLNDVLDMSRLESGKVTVEEKEVDLRNLMHDLKAIVQPEMNARHLHFQMDALHVENETVFCDPLRIRQVLVNILNNAMKYTPAGGQVQMRLIQAGAPRDGLASYEFRVKDSGIGMSAAFLEHVFEPFEREQTSTISGIPGTGLGLTIARNVAAMMGGHIRAESEEGKGSEFFVTVPLKVVGEAAAAPVSGLDGQRCLIVTADKDLGASLAAMGRAAGLRPDVAPGGKEAVARAKKAKEEGAPYQVALIDAALPGLGGLETAGRLRDAGGEPPRLILLVSGDGTEAGEGVKASGVAEVCARPVFASDLRTLLAPQGGEENGADEEAGADFQGRPVLLVDDNEMNLEIGQMILEDAGLVVDTAEDGAEAVEKIEAAPAGTWELVFMDVQMPRMNGYAATRAIRALADPQKAAIPIVAMTANAFEEDRQEAYESGMNGYVPKPIDVKKLMATLHTFLGKKK